MRTSTTYFLFAVLLLIAGRIGQLVMLGGEPTALDGVIQVLVFAFCALTAIAGLIQRIRELSPSGTARPARGEGTMDPPRRTHGA